MKEMIYNIGSRLVIKMRVVNMAMRDGDYSENFRECPSYSEFVGMTQMLQTMDIEFEIEWNHDVTQMTAVIVMGRRFEV